MSGDASSDNKKTYNSDCPTSGTIVFRTGAEVDVYELEKLCDKVGWPRRPVRKVELALRNR